MLWRGRTWFDGGGGGFFDGGGGGVGTDGQFIEEEGKKSRHGNGTFVDGPETYAGSWVNDAMEGEGTFNFASGATYVGGFANSQFDGEGKYTWADGASYQVGRA